MLNLYWKSGDKTRTLVDKPFDSEADFEQYLFENQELLGGDIFIIFRQIRTGNKQGIPDMLGLDQDSRICIIELKNQEASESILPQALEYAIWAETNPDSIKAIWLESKNKPEDIIPDWDNLDIRIILVAPSFKTTVPRMAGKINYQVDLIQVGRYCLEKEEFLAVEVLDATPPIRPTTTKVMGDWDWEYYESEHGKEATDQVRSVVGDLEKIVTEMGWILPFNINKYYVGFKLGNRVVFNVAWGGTYTWNVRFKMPKEEAQAFKSNNWEFQRFDNNFHEASFRPLQLDYPHIEELKPLLLQAYKYVSGRK